jgi:RNA-directed DNA polymerase
VSKATFGYLGYFTWNRVLKWLRHKYRRSSWKELRRRYLQGGWWPAQDDVILFDPKAVSVTRYRYRGAKIATPWDGWIKAMAAVA